MGLGDGYERKKVSGHFPECGAIFISNRSTLKECFERRLFGLPVRFSSFIKSVKAGMILFLFEFEERKLYGVFEAISDGGMNIVPSAYRWTGREFPAQVKFTTIWDCDPLFESEFCDSIQDNYFDTYKFNFGLSLGQTQSLLQLFDSKRRIPKSLHCNKSRSRKFDYKSTAAGLKKGRFTEIQFFERKLNSEPVEEMFSLSSDSCKKYESIHFDDDAYDPERPSFHGSNGSGAYTTTSHESDEPLTSQQKEGNLNVSAEECEDYIPLLSPDHSDLEEEGLDYIPRLPLGPISSREGNKQVKMEHPFTSSHGSPSNATLPLSDGNNHLQSVPPKSMFSDKPKKGASVFSRLDFSLKYVLENQNKHPRQKKKRFRPQKHESGNCSMDKRTSVLLRLTSSSDAVAQPALYDRTEGGNQ